jgi:hypothetical protein
MREHRNCPEYNTYTLNIYKLYSACKEYKGSDKQDIGHITAILVNNSGVAINLVYLIAESVFIQLIRD